MSSWISTSPTETERIAINFAKNIAYGKTVAFFGDLGSGKTTFIRAFTSYFGVDAHTVNSPTFQYLNIYKAKTSIYHFDLYRLHDASQFFDMGFDEFFESDGITCIEWAEKIEAYLPKKCVFVRLEHIEESVRRIVIDEN